MAGTVYAKRYSQAIFEIALEKKELDKWQSELKKIADLARNSALMAAMENPKFPFNDKVKLLSEQLGDVNQLTLNLVYLLVAKGKLSLIGKITEEYQRLLDSHRGIEQADVLTTVPLNDTDKLKLAERLGAISGKKVVIKAEVDSRIIGGIVAKIGGKLLDGSIRNRLETLKRELSGVKG
ncbi:MAG: ATP synthase F1 subunit delta [Chloroflexi bacterium]|nr:ATP synthase F1 subunit delta [Chloroflexota bacterium]